MDNSATTCCTQDVADAVAEAMLRSYGNPSSAHSKGMEAEMLLRSAREDLAATLRCRPDEIVLTSGGTESDNWAVLGTARTYRRRGRHLITTAVEHAAILEPMKALEKEGYTVTYLPVDHWGRISLEDLKAALDDETILVSIMAVNNEVGAMQPIREAAQIVKAYDPAILFHTDAVQAYGKIPLQPGRDGIDLMSVSSHKFHGPKGIGFLYLKEKTRLQPLILGGGQQKGLRSGTDNVSGAVGMARAAVNACSQMDGHTAHFLSLKERLMDGLQAMDDVRLHSLPGSEGAPHIVNASFVGVRSEVLLHALEERGIYVSAGSACSTNHHLPVSPVLQQMHLPRNEMESALRFSFSIFNTREQVDTVLEALRELLPALRRFTRR